MRHATLRRISSRALARFAGAALLIAACGTETPAPSATPPRTGPTQGALLILTPTTIPLAPLEEGAGVSDSGIGAEGVSNPTQAGLAAEGEPAQPLPSVTPQPTEARFPMAVGAADGLLMQGSYYSAAQRPAPGVLMLHQGGSDRRVWDDLARRLQGAGYAVLAVDLRGYGDTGGEPDWGRAPADVAAALTQLAELPGISPGRLVVVGAGIGANLGLNACADRAGCVAAVLLSPGLDYLGVTTADAMTRMGQRAVLIIASENDDNNPADSVTLDGLAQGDSRLVIVPGAGHGTELFGTQPDLVPLIAEWLAEQLPAPESGATNIPPG